MNTKSRCKHFFLYLKIFACLERLLHCAAEVLYSADVLFCSSTFLYDMHNIYMFVILFLIFVSCVLFTINVDGEFSLLPVAYPVLWLLPVLPKVLCTSF